MHRRALLGTIVVAMAAGCVGEAAPSGPRNPPGEDEAPSPDPEGDEAGLFQEAFDYYAGDDGELLVELTVGNDAAEERSGTVVVTVTVDDESFEDRADVSVPSGESETVVLDPGVSHDAFEAGGGLRVEIQ